MPDNTSIEEGSPSNSLQPLTPVLDIDFLDKNKFPNLIDKSQFLILYEQLDLALEEYYNQVNENVMKGRIRELFIKKYGEADEEKINNIYSLISDPKQDYMKLTDLIANELGIVQAHKEFEFISSIKNLNNLSQLERYIRRLLSNIVSSKGVLNFEDCQRVMETYKNFQPSRPYDLSNIFNAVEVNIDNLTVDESKIILDYVSNILHSRFPTLSDNTLHRITRVIYVIFQKFKVETKFSDSLIKALLLYLEDPNPVVANTALTQLYYYTKANREIANFIDIEVLYRCWQKINHLPSVRYDLFDLLTYLPSNSNKYLFVNEFTDILKDWKNPKNFKLLFNITYYLKKENIISVELDEIIAQFFESDNKDVLTAAFTYFNSLEHNFTFLDPYLENILALRDTPSYRYYVLTIALNYPSLGIQLGKKVKSLIELLAIDNTNQINFALKIIAKYSPKDDALLNSNAQLFLNFLDLNHQEITKNVFDILVNLNNDAQIQVDGDTLLVQDLKRIIPIVDEIYESYIYNAIAGYLIKQLVFSKDPITMFNNIKEILSRNNLPYVAKVFKIFQIINTPEVIDKKLKKNHQYSPIVQRYRQTSQRLPGLIGDAHQITMKIILRDLINVHIRSNNKELIAFASLFVDVFDILIKIEEGAHITEEEELAAKLALNKIYSLGMSLEREVTDTKDSTDLLLRVQGILKDFEVDSIKELYEWFTKEILLPINIKSPQELLDRMDVVRSSSLERKLNLIKDNKMVIQEGDMLKGMGQGKYPDYYLNNIITNGSVAKDFLGGAATEDWTPLDTDLSIVLSEDVGSSETFRSAILKSLAGNYGDVIIYFHNDSRFVNSTFNPNSRFDENTYELFVNDSKWGKRHGGVRTGIGSHDIDAILLSDEVRKDPKTIERIKFNLAINKMYIPLTNYDGNVLWTYEEYLELESQLESIKNIDLDKFQFLINSERIPYDSDAKTNVLIDTLCEIEFFKQLYDSDTGVSEKYTLKEHTSVVMNNFERFFGKTVNESLRKIFRTIFLLHDLGKPLAIRYTGDKANQHTYNEIINNEVVKIFKLDHQSQDLIVNITNQNIIGDLFENKITTKVAVARIRSLSTMLEMSYSELLDILYIYYCSDASAYTEFGGGKVSLDYIFSVDDNNISLQDDFQKKYLELKSTV